MSSIKKRRTSSRLAKKSEERQKAAASCETQSSASKGPSQASISTSNKVLKSVALGLPQPKPGVVRDCDLIGEELVGREILICWDDGLWYDAVVVRYYPRPDEYKVVYRADDGVEITSLRKRRWTIAPKKSRINNSVILDGAIIQFIYPPDGKTYKAMIYDFSNSGKRIKIAYLNEHSTDTLKGEGWQFLTSSPCIEEDNDQDAEKYVEDAIIAIKVGNEIAKSKPGTVVSGRVSKKRKD